MSVCEESDETRYYNSFSTPNLEYSKTEHAVAQALRPLLLLRFYLNDLIAWDYSG